MRPIIRVSCIWFPLAVSVTLRPLFAGRRLTTSRRGASFIDDAIGRLMDEAPPAARAFWSSFESLVDPLRRTTLALKRGSLPNLPPLSHCVLRTFHHWLSGAQVCYFGLSFVSLLCVSGCVRAGRHRRGL